MKFQKAFGGTHPKPSSEAPKTVRQVGHSSAVSPNGLSNNRGQADTKAYKPSSSSAHRPSIKGKVDNRKVGQ